VLCVIQTLRLRPCFFLLAIAFTATQGCTSTAAAPAPASSPASAPGVPTPAAGPTGSPDCNRVVRASEFARACTRDADCVAIYEGPVSSACQCAYTAIARSDFPKYQAIMAEHASCSHPEQCAADCIAVAGNAASCTGGTCAYHPPKP
jgi:hypothetical protein